MEIQLFSSARRYLQSNVKNSNCCFYWNKCSLFPVSRYNLGSILSVHKGPCNSVFIPQEETEYESNGRAGEKTGWGWATTEAELLRTKIERAHKTEIWVQPKGGIQTLQSFESGDKAGKLLARYIKQQESMATITAVRSEEGALVTKSVDINEAF